MGKIVVTLMILFLIFLFFQGFAALEDFFVPAGDGQRADAAELSAASPALNKPGVDHLADAGLVHDPILFV